MDNRIFAVDFQDGNSIEVAKKLVSVFSQHGKAFIFAKDTSKFDGVENIAQVVAFGDMCDNHSKCKNFITKFFKDQNFTGFLHVVESNVEVVSDPTAYLAELEHAMDVLDYDVYFSTISDGCNYVYSKFIPRVSVQLDNEMFDKLGLPKSIRFTSHSNTAWITYNYAKVPDGLLSFNDNFDIAMYYIIEFLARRRNTKKAGQLYLMNQYLSVPAEVGVFKVLQQNAPDNKEQMAKEDAIFKSLKVNYTPDNNIDQLLEDIVAKLKSKI